MPLTVDSPPQVQSRTGALVALLFLSFAVVPSLQTAVGQAAIDEAAEPAAVPLLPAVGKHAVPVGPAGDPSADVLSPAERLLSGDLSPAIDRTGGPSGRVVGNPVFPAAGLGASGSTAGVDRRILNAIREGQQEGRYRVLTQGLTNRVPFGYTKPTLFCEPLRASLIRLEPGETVWAAIPADPVSWSVQLSESGPGGITPIVVVKPLTEEPVLTNLFISTDRRIYEVMLQSGTDEAQEILMSPDRSSILDFYYPEDVIRRVETASLQAQQQESGTRAYATTRAPAELATGIPLERMRFSYTWTKDRHFPWEPEAVFDDGAHVYITLPDNARHEAGAVLFVKGMNGENTLLEYAVRDGRIITDRVFREAQFIYAEPSKRKKPKRYVLTIKNRDR